ncbi:hypothetical protein [Bacillus wiedmannii]|uniref:hypothetical protein n=1 Tax=Bacillus wiedmannii TaxID=1890302 RepID=UPI003F6586B0
MWTNNKRNEQCEDKYQTVIEKKQEVIEEQAKAVEFLSKDVSEINQKFFKDDDK